MKCVQSRVYVIPLDPLGVSVCIVCYKVFPTKEALGMHKTADHSQVKERNGDCFVDETK